MVAKPMLCEAHQNISKGGDQGQLQQQLCGGDSAGHNSGLMMLFMKNAVSAATFAAAFDIQAFHRYAKLCRGLSMQLADSVHLQKGRQCPCCQLQCLLDNLLLSKDGNGEGLSMQSLRDQLMTLLVAGQETSAILLGWTLAFLAQNPQVQSQAAAEVAQVLQGQQPTPESIK